jgi:nucleoside-diphosphate-sugar epimerase
MPGAATLLMTGATGLVGGHLYRQFLTTRPELRFVLLTRCPKRIAAPFRDGRTLILYGDLREPELGISSGTRRQLQAEVTEIIHCAANTRFDCTLAEARATNTDGTAKLVDLAKTCRSLEKFGYVSTVYVVGRSTGRFPEAPCWPDKGFVNAYQQSKCEAEQMVVQAMNEIPAAIFRLSSIIGDAATGHVRQFNYIHQLLKLLPYGSILPMIPCEPSAPADIITTDWAEAALAYLFEFGFVPGQAYHVCAGPERSIKIGRLVELSLDIFASHPGGQRSQPITLPRQVDLATWEEYVKQTRPNANSVLGELLRVLNYFAAHLALHQVFENDRTSGSLREGGVMLPPMADCYARMVRYCLDTNWGRQRSGAPLGARQN